MGESNDGLHLETTILEKSQETFQMASSIFELIVQKQRHCPDSILGDTRQISL